MKLLGYLKYVSRKFKTDHYPRDSCVEDRPNVSGHRYTNPPSRDNEAVNRERLLRMTRESGTLRSNLAHFHHLATDVVDPITWALEFHAKGLVAVVQDYRIMIQEARNRKR